MPQKDEAGIEGPRDANPNQGPQKSEQASLRACVRRKGTTSMRRQVIGLLKAGLLRLPRRTESGR
jgi:hypothetical protein